jgi:hypothetical protein
MTPQVDAAIATNAAFKRNHLEIAGMRPSLSLTKLPASVTSCMNGVPVKGLDGGLNSSLTLRPMALDWANRK